MTRPSCGERGSSLQAGEWVPLSADLAATAIRQRASSSCLRALGSTCPERDPWPVGHDRLLEYVPVGCSLPIAVLTTEGARPVGVEAALRGRSLRFVGDSVSQQVFLYLSACTLEGNCTRWHDPVHMQSLTSRLRAAGYDALTANLTSRGLRGNAGRAPWGFNSCSRPRISASETGFTVDYRRMERLPPPGSGQIAATMHALAYFGPAPLRFEDVLVLNVGLHYAPNEQRELHSAVEEALVWWSAERAAGRAPALLWRETTPQHFQGEGGFFPTDGLATVSSPLRLTRECRSLSEEEVSRRGAAGKPLISLLRERGVRVVDVFRPLASRSDEHPLMYYESPDRRSSLWKSLRARAQQQPREHDANGSAATLPPDCTHFCGPSSSLRFVARAVLAAVAEQSITNSGH